MDWKIYVGFNNIIDLYLTDKTDQVTHKRGGQYMPSLERDVVERIIYTFNLKLNPDDADTIYVYNC